MTKVVEKVEKVIELLGLHVRVEAVPGAPMEAGTTSWDNAHEANPRFTADTLHDGRVKNLATWRVAKPRGEFLGGREDRYTIEGYTFVIAVVCGGIQKISVTEECDFGRLAAALLRQRFNVDESDDAAEFLAALEDPDLARTWVSQRYDVGRLSDGRPVVDRKAFPASEFFPANGVVTRPREPVAALVWRHGIVVMR